MSTKVSRKRKKVSECDTVSCLDTDSSLKNKLLDLYYNHKEKCDHLWIKGVITDEDLNYSDIYDKLAEYGKSNKKALIIHYNSSGGASEGGNLLYNLIKLFKKPIIAVNESMVMSAATYSFLACDLKIAKPFSFFLIHQTSTYYSPSTEILKETFKEQRRETYEGEMNHQLTYEFYQANSKLSIKEIKSLLRSNKLLSSTECLKMGFIDHIFKPSLVKKVKSTNSEVREIMFSTFIKDLSTLTDSEVLATNNLKSIVVYIDYPVISTFEMFLYINQMLEVPIPIDFIYLTSVNEFILLIGLFARHSIILKSKSLIKWRPNENLTRGNKTLLEDNISYVNTLRKTVTDIFKTKSKLPPKILNEIFFKKYAWSMEEGLKYGLVSEIVDPGKNKKLIIDDILDKPLLSE